MNTRTTFNLPTSLFQRLHLAAKQENISVSKLASNLLEKALAKKEQRQIQHTYAVLKEMRGMGGEGDADASTSIDELLYGEEGAWRGEPTSGTDR